VVLRLAKENNPEQTETKVNIFARFGTLHEVRSEIASIIARKRALYQVQIET
jgi:hypothetical protein